MTFSAMKRKRCLAAVRARLPKHGLMKSCRMVSDIENVSAKTLEAWHYEDKKRQQEAVRAKEKTEQEKSKRLYRGSEQKPESSAGRFPLVPDPPPAPPEVKPRLLTDGGQLSCSRCRSTAHIEYRMETYHCGICGILEFSGFTEDMELKTYKVISGPHSWMA